ncbi:vacuolar membrane protein-domain-containing protein, partial [Butyriboletus roseoflavus]
MSSVPSVITKSLGEFPLDHRSCQLLGPTALVVQALMGVLAVLSLVYKRHWETQKRPWKIWLFDVSKQVFGQMFVHGLNVLISDLGSHHSAGNACTYYFLNILLDTTLGIGLIYLVLQSATWLLSKKLGIKGLKTGQYGNPPSVAFWVRQTAVYVFSITTMKLLVVALFAVWPGISSIGDWLLSWIGDEESVQVIFVMGIFPIFMNIVQFWVIDSIVKASYQFDRWTLCLASKFRLSRLRAFVQFSR